MTPQSSPNFALDPQGFRGTATARRLRLLRRRRQWQTLLATLSILAIGAATGWFFARPRDQSFTVQRERTLSLDLSAPATLDEQGALWLTSASGALWKIGSDGAIGSDFLASKASAPPLVSTSGIFAPGLDGSLMAFDGGDKTLWTRDLGGALSTSPALWRAGDATILAVGDSDGRVIALNASDGETVWKTYLGGPIGNALVATRAGFVAPTLANGIWRGGLVCLDGRSGRTLWKFPVQNMLASGLALPLFDGATERVYWNNDEGEVACLDAASGRVFWQISVAPADASRAVMMRAAPILIGQNLLVGGNDGLLRALDARTGNALWNVDLGTPIRSLYPTNFGAHRAILAVGAREIFLIDAQTHAIIERDQGAMAWPLSGGNGAVVVSDDGQWRRVSW